MSRLFFFALIHEIRNQNELASGGTETSASVYQSIYAIFMECKKKNF